MCWPTGGEIVRFDGRGIATIMLQLPQEAEGIAFGAAGTPLAGLMFVSHATGGQLTMVELASLKTVTGGPGGTRGDFLHIGPDGRLFICNRIKWMLVLLAPPLVIAATPTAGCC